MKKQILCLMSLAFLLSGCGNVQASISNGSDKVMTIGDKTYTKEEEYNYVKKSSGPSITMQLIQNEIYDKEIKVDKKIRKEASDLYKEQKKSTKNIEEQIKIAGYKDKEDYMNKAIIPSIQSQKLLEKYFADNQKEIQKHYKPSMAKVIECKSEKDAKKAIKDLKSKKSIKSVVKKYGHESSSFTGEESVVSTNSSMLPTRLINTLTETKDMGLIDEVFANENDEIKSYFVAILVSNDYEKNISKYSEELNSDESLSEECLVYYLDKYDFEVHDQEIFDYLRYNNPKFLVSHPELAEQPDEAK